MYLFVCFFVFCSIVGLVLWISFEKLLNLTLVLLNLYLPFLNTVDLDQLDSDKADSQFSTLKINSYIWNASGYQNKIGDECST